MKDMDQQKPCCRNCEFANSLVTKWPFVFCYIKCIYKLRCGHCKFHAYKTKRNFTNTL